MLCRLTLCYCWWCTRNWQAMKWTVHINHHHLSRLHCSVSRPSVLLWQFCLFALNFISRISIQRGTPQANTFPVPIISSTSLAAAAAAGHWSFALPSDCSDKAGLLRVWYWDRIPSFVLGLYKWLDMRPEGWITGGYVPWDTLWI